MNITSFSSDNKEKHTFSFKERMRSFGYAFRGLKQLVIHEHNARIHLVLAVVAVLLGCWVGLSAVDWVAVVFAIGLVLAAESFNTAIEYVCNLVCPTYDERVKKIKDIAAAAVLLCAITAAVIGVIVFVPALMEKVGL